jgi:hypothetical protein
LPSTTLSISPSALKFLAAKKYSELRNDGKMEIGGKKVLFFAGKREGSSELDVCAWRGRNGDVIRAEVRC